MSSKLSVSKPCSHRCKYHGESKMSGKCCSGRSDVYSKCFERKFIRRALRFMRANYKRATVDVLEIYNYQCKKVPSSQRRAMSERWDTMDKLSHFLHENLGDKCILSRDERNNRYTALLCVGSFDLETDQQVEKVMDDVSRETRRDDCIHSNALSVALMSDATMNRSKTHGDLTKALKPNGTEPQKQIDYEDVLNVNSLIIDSFSGNTVRKSAYEDKIQSPSAVASAATSRGRVKWPLSRPRVCMPYSEKYRYVDRRLKMEKMLESIGFDNDASSTGWSQQNKERSSVNNKSSLEELKLEMETLRDKENRRPNWLCRGITVRVATSRLGKKFLWKTADVIELKHDYTALIRFHHCGSVLYADQNHLQTVILGGPSKHGIKVLIVNGAYRGCTGLTQEPSIAVR